MASSRSLLVNASSLVSCLFVITIILMSNYRINADDLDDILIDGCSTADPDCLPFNTEASCRAEPTFCAGSGANCNCTWVVDRCKCKGAIGIIE